MRVLAMIVAFLCFHLGLNVTAHLLLPASPLQVSGLLFRALLLAIGYLLLKDRLPGQSRLAKGIFFGLLLGVGCNFPTLFYTTGDAATAVTGLLVGLLDGLALGYLFPSYEERPFRFGSKALLITALGTLLFPPLLLIAATALGFDLPAAFLNIFAATGGTLALACRSVRANPVLPWWRRGLWFGAIFYGLLMPWRAAAFAVAAAVPVVVVSLMAASLARAGR